MNVSTFDISAQYSRFCVVLERWLVYNLILNFWRGWFSDLSPDHIALVEGTWMQIGLKNLYATKLKLEFIFLKKGHLKIFTILPKIVFDLVTNTFGPNFFIFCVILILKRFFFFFQFGMLLWYFWTYINYFFW